ncbi:MAG: hypothetical protein IJI45_12135 [Anaerolineaceae bacterium]|nr:hypothetical protein [Anaerolineaceae bacterium]
MNQKKRQIIFVLSVLVSVLAVLWAVNSIRHLPHYDYSLDDWKSEHAVYKNNGFSVDDEIKGTDVRVDFLWGPYKPLKKGSYTANIRYSSEYDQRCIATAAGGQAELFDSSYAHLSYRLNKAAYQFEVRDDVDEFQLVFNYSGMGEFTVHEISIVPNGNQQKRIASEIIALMIFINILLIYAEKPRDVKRTALVLTGITVLISLPLVVRGIHNGHDLGVHYLRIEAIVQAIRSAQFPARISSVTLYGLGYPFSIYYNDLFLYFPALLRLLGFSVDLAYKVYVVDFNFLTVLTAWWCFRKIFKDNNMGLILALLYSTASYRMMNIYVRGAVGEYTAQVFLPLLALAFYRMYFEKADTLRQIVSNGVLLALAMSGIIGSHVLTTIMVVFLMILFCLYFWRTTFTKPVIGAFCTGVVLSLLLNAYFLVPFIDYYFTVPTAIRKVVDSDLNLIQILGIFPAQYFAFFQGLFGHAVPDVDGRIQLTPGLPLMLLFCIGLYFRVIRNHKKNKTIQRLSDAHEDGHACSGYAAQGTSPHVLCPVQIQKIYDFPLIFSFLTMWLASSVFPWNWLTLHFPLWNILVQIQFPYRFLVPGILFLTILSGCVLKYEKLPYLKQAVVFAAVVMGIWFMSDYFNGGSFTYVYDQTGVIPTATGLEYLLDGSQRENITTGVYGENMAEAAVLSQNSYRLELYCKADQNSGNHLVDAPLYAYKGYHVLDSDGNEYAYYPGIQNRINFELPDGFDGKITIVFRDPVYWRIALWVSIITAATLAVYLVRNRERFCVSARSR